MLFNQKKLWFHVQLVPCGTLYRAYLANGLSWFCMKSSWFSLEPVRTSGSYTAPEREVDGRKSKACFQ